MAGRIRQEDVEALRERADLVQVVSAHLQLKKAGRDSLVGLCPFHAERTPSFSVSPSKQLYYCFGCGEGGDVFRFLEKAEGLSFVEAAERLAGQAGVTLRYEGRGADRGQPGRRPVLHRAVAEAASLYHRLLREGREGGAARAYLASRGISPESVERFEVGYAPGYPDFLLKRLARRFSPEVLVEAGLVARDGSGALRDRFRGRVMFPVHDLAGNAVGFGGRLVEPPGGPRGAAGRGGTAGPPGAAPAGSPGAAGPGGAKYVNSPDTPVYRKGSLLYNLHRAKADITRSGRAFVVEGYTDVIALDQAGVGAVVATCGTALGEDHLRLLARFTERAVLAFDSDEAGARAAERAFDFFERYPVELSVLVLPEGRDPADFVAFEGPAAGERFLDLAGRAVPLVEYMVDRLLGGSQPDSAEGRSRATRQVVQRILARLQDPVLRDEYVARVAGRIGVSENAVMLELERALSAGGDHRAGPERAHRARVAPEEEVEAEVLKLLVQSPEACSRHLDSLDPEGFSKPTHRKAFELIAGAWREAGGPVAPASLVSAAQQRPGGDQLGRFLASLAVDRPKLGEEPVEEYAERLVLRLEEFRLKRQADAIRRQLERVNPLTSQADHDALFEQLVALEGARRLVRARAEAVGTPP